MRYLKVFTDFVETIEALGDAERGRLFTAMLEYSRSGIAPDLRGNERFIWAAAKQMIDREAEEYEKLCERNKRNASRTQSQPVAPSGSATQPVAPSGTQDKDKDKDNKERITKVIPKKVSKATESEVAEYVRQNGLNVDPHEFVAYFEAGNWHDSEGKPVLNWKQKIRTWNSKRSGSPAVKRMGAHAGYQQTQLTDEDFEAMFIDLDKPI